MCEGEAVAGVSPSGKARWESPESGECAQRPLTQTWTPADTTSRSPSVFPSLSIFLSIFPVSLHPSIPLSPSLSPSEWSLWPGHQPIWMAAGNEFADRLAVKGAEAHQHSESTVEEIAGIKSLGRTVQMRVATVTLHMAEQYPNMSILVSHPRKRVPPEECTSCPRMRL